jgi:hypothetical protein
MLQVLQLRRPSQQYPAGLECRGRSPWRARVKVISSLTIAACGATTAGRPRALRHWCQPKNGSEAVGEIRMNPVIPDESLRIATAGSMRPRKVKPVPRTNPLPTAPAVATGIPSSARTPASRRVLNRATLCSRGGDQSGGRGTRAARDLACRRGAVAHPSHWARTVRCNTLFTRNKGSGHESDDE